MKGSSDATGSPRTNAERVTFAVSLAVVLLVLAGIASLMFSGSEQTPPDFELTTTSVRPVGGSYQVSIMVANTGGTTAAAVRVRAELTIDNETQSDDQEVHLLAGGQTHELVFVFDRDPAYGKLDVQVSSYAVP